MQLHLNLFDDSPQEPTAEELAQARKARKAELEKLRSQQPEARARRRELEKLRLQNPEAREHRNELQRARYDANREKKRAYAREWMHNNGAKVSVWRKDFRRRLKQQVIDAYGGSCACCGETVFEFMTIDHTLGDGAEHRREIKGVGASFRVYRDLIQRGFPEGYQILCVNCNVSRGRYGYCPHRPGDRCEVFATRAKPRKDPTEYLREAEGADSETLRRLRNNAYMQAWNAENRERVNGQRRERRRQRRATVIAAYGGACACCGETAYEFLCIDHTNADGAAHRKALNENSGADKTYRDIIKRGFPPEFRCLCYNCNTTRGFYGYCPHKPSDPSGVPPSKRHLNGTPE